MKRLSAATFSQAAGFDPPDYDRTASPPIVHVGVGAFARAHLCVYADDLLRSGRPALIHGVSLRSPRAQEQLGPQDGLFTVTTREPSAEPATLLIGSLASVTTGAQAASDAIASPHTQLVTLTVTEKGYELDGPDSVPAVLAHAFEARRRLADAPLVVASLDNLHNNGQVLQERVLLAANVRAGDLADWITDHVTFPRSVVDRMVPATTSGDRAAVAQRLGLLDEAATVAEAHRSWVLESVGSLPNLHESGVAIVDDIEPYQRRKLWLLNGPHSALAYAGLVAGHRTIAEAVADPVLHRFVEALIADVVAVASIEDLHPAAFAASALRRFANPAIGHACAQVGADGSRKLPQRLLPVMALRHEQHLGTERFELVLAAWLVAVTATPARGIPLPTVDDPASIPIRSALEEGGPSAAVAAALGEDSALHHRSVAAAFARIVREGVHALEEVT